MGSARVVNDRFYTKIKTRDPFGRIWVTNDCLSGCALQYKGVKTCTRLTTLLNELPFVVRQWNIIRPVG